MSDKGGEDGPDSSFNLSDWALRHRSFVFYLMIISAVAGFWAYNNLGREEDPPFTIKTMVVKTLWPGATTVETLEQVTDRIEKKLEELPLLDFTRSYTKPGESVVFVNLKDTAGAEAVPDLWYQVRKKIGDIKHTFPSGIRGPFFNDEFGDTYSLIYAMTSDGFTHREMRDYAEDVRARLLGVPDVAKVDLVGVQDEKIYLEFSTQKIASLGLNLNALMQSLQEQNAITPSGVLDAGPESIAIRVTGQFTSEESLREINFKVGDRFFRLSDIANVRRAYVEPSDPMFRYNGEPAIGLAVAMTTGGDVLALGEHIKERVDQEIADLPIGIDIHLVADQPHVVEEAVGEFTKSLGEAVVIVLAVSFFALGWRPGVVVAIAIPLVLGVTFVLMDFADISLQRISLGALIIALGLLVDDAMIAVEMMIKKMEEGHSRERAATFTYTLTAFPMLTGTLVTIVGFVPVGFARSAAGEYCFSLFAVIGFALIVSWIVAVLFTPLTGVYILPAKMKGHDSHKPSRIMRWFRALLDWSMRRNFIVLGTTIALFALSIVGMTLVQQQFFPKSDRAELLVDLTLPQGSSINATREAADRAEAIFKADPGIDHWSFYVGQGVIRFYLPLDTQLANNNFAQAVVVTKGFEVRDDVAARLEQAFADGGFDNVMARVSPLELGPPVGWPLKFRISGPDPMETREFAHQFADVLGGNDAVRNINYDWNELSKVVRVDVDQDRARSLGISSQQLANSINAILSGTTITQLRDATYLVDIVGRAIPEERATLETLRTLKIGTPGGDAVPLSQIASLSYDLEPPRIWRRKRQPTVTVQAELTPGVEASTVVSAMSADIDSFRADLPAGYDLAIGGSTEESAEAQKSIFVVFPLMLFLMATILMIQLQSIQRVAIVFLTAPLSLIGVAAALLIANAPMGFVAILGVISLAGMVIRNSVILITQIDLNISSGVEPWAAVVDATEHRLRPILLTAAAAILAMIPIAPTVFWGPMAYAIMGGLAVATLLTLVFLPTLYVTWFRISPPDPDRAASPASANAAPVAA